MDEAYELMGCGIAYLKETSYTFTAEAHFRYLRELHAGMQVRRFSSSISTPSACIISSSFVHAEEGWLPAMSENMVLHITRRRRRWCPFPISSAHGLPR